VAGNDCTTVPGEQTDVDGDGILDDFTATYSCTRGLGFAHSYA
jgi:hypothetical protein